MAMIKKTLIIGAVIGLTACAHHSPLTTYQQNKQNTYAAGVMDYATRAAKPHEAHATLRIYPYVSHFGHGRFSPYPMNIKQINDVVINPKNTLTQPYEFKMPFEQINVPIGQQTIIAGRYQHRHIQFSMNFEAGKHYIIKPEAITAGRDEWRVYEYEHDDRFAKNAKEGIILGQAVTPVLRAVYSWKE